ncbi:MAG: hypothetical protein CVV56_08090 [Tenericutes bacterium HGW-Tenericutes-1]|jgi:hypothetical protein|nr:MAG: hypothetical protein CVV56_08090 [Tenericutes bacterium HGW-Tenericutes-1]PKM95805.1 MAG: hypothetical protein CVU84_03120 [Firmicutes bacterium HGW-Firmicutes-1]
MIPIELQDYLKDSIKELLNGFKVKNSNNELSDFNIYSQNIPVKQGKKDKEHYPLIVIAIDEGRSSDDDDPASADIAILVGIYDDSEDNQGYRDAINVGNKIINYLLSQTHFDNKHTLKLPLSYQLPQEDISPYFLLAINTTWNVPQITIKDDQYT